jgi:hypothetical protein
MLELRVLFNTVETNYEFKPLYFPLEGHTFWIFERGKVHELHFDAKQWH